MNIEVYISVGTQTLVGIETSDSPSLAEDWFTAGRSQESDELGYFVFEYSALKRVKTVGLMKLIPRRRVAKVGLANSPPRQTAAARL